MGRNGYGPRIYQAVDVIEAHRREKILDELTRVGDDLFAAVVPDFDCVEVFLIGDFEFDAKVEEAPLTNSVFAFQNFGVSERRAIGINPSGEDFDLDLLSESSLDSFEHQRNRRSDVQRAFPAVVFGQGAV